MIIMHMYLLSVHRCKINWKEGKNITVRSMVKKQKNAKTGKERMITKTMPADSFFNFFSPPVRKYLYTWDWGKLV